MNDLIKSVLVITLLLLISCGESQNRNSEQQTNKDHVWKDQVEMLDKARKLEDMALDSAAKRRKQIEDQGG